MFIFYYGTVQTCNISLRQTKGGSYSTHTHTHLGGNSASEHAALGHINANQRIQSGQRPQTLAAFKEMNKWKTPTQAKVRVERRGGEVLKADNGCMTDICLKLKGS